MKITIDTKADSKYDIKRAIGLLQSLIDEKEESFPVQESPQTASMMGMFTDDPQVQERTQEPEESKSDVPEEKEVEGKHTLIPY